MLALSLGPWFRRRDGRLFLVAIGLWAIARAIVAATWRDPLVLGPLRAEQVIDLIVAAASAALVRFVALANRRRADDPDLDSGAVVRSGTDARR